MKPLKKYQIGKRGLTETFVDQIKNGFKKVDFIKISILKSAARDKEKAQDIAEALLKSLGHEFTYRLIGYTLSIRKWKGAKANAYPQIVMKNNKPTKPKAR